MGAVGGEGGDVTNIVVGLRVGHSDTWFILLPNYMFNINLARCCETTSIVKPFHVFIVTN